MDSSASRAVPLIGDEELYAESALHASIPDALFNLTELDVLYEDTTATLWTYINPEGRPSFTPAMLNDFESWQSLISQGFGRDKVPLRYLVLGSRSPDVFCFGGDLDLFQKLIRERDRDGLVNYGHRCCAILDRNIRTLDIPMLTVGLVQGTALGGGFEALLSFDFIIAERQATFGLPEIMFGLYPGMGAHALLSRKLGSAMADRIIMSNETYTAEQMYDMGIVHQLAEPGDGLNATRDFIKKSERRHAGMVGARLATKKVWQLELDELNRITEMWVDAALELREHDLKVMSRLVAAQARLAERIAAA
ncbi:crotonase/enoyl-CoA hydratase family protein [Erythrobacter crassostreae]|uniref:Crotonase/enoyl-CoA hydratase family protein n=1 Tax=Erythrobacter crassostreae TaxID=2828328 RepID=A0A9X1JLM2_9SPHN|nr:crotonase/enoyl-CoA hydratase family protein [Erythrobacter crassostrea]MBV7260186.1 crotonase/enoyl-CoA hydratase family protein [Erythrobacter crassostrea]